MRSMQMPTKTREVRNHHMDSRVWDRVAFRDGDIVIATYAKSGTTWMQQIVAELALGSGADIDVHAVSFWLDFRLGLEEKLATLEAQRHRRFIKTHLPVDALVMSPKARYLYIGRDARDVVWSLHNHHVHANENLFSAVNNPAGLVGPPFPRDVPDVHAYFRHWLAHDGAPWWPFWENIRSWWAIRDLGNVRLIHFNDLKRDLEGSMREIATFLGVAPPEDLWPRLVERCSFDYMKRHAQRFAPRGGLSWEGGAQTFINKGTNGRWRDVLTADDNRRYEDTALRELGPDCARWLFGE